MRFTKSLFLTRSGAKLIALHLLSISHHWAVSSKVGPKPFCSVLYNGFITFAACTKIAWKRFYCSSSELLSNMEKSLWRCNMLSIISKNIVQKLLSSLFRTVCSFPCLISHSYLLNLYILPFGPLLHLKTMHGWDENKLLFEPSLVNCNIQTSPTIRIVKMDRVKRTNYCLLKLKLKEKKCNHCGTNKKKRATHYSLLRWSKNSRREKTIWISPPQLGPSPGREVNLWHEQQRSPGDIWILSGWLLFRKYLTTLFDNSCL